MAVIKNPNSILQNLGYNHLSMDDNSQSRDNFDHFRDCVFSSIVAKLSPVKPKSKSTKRQKLAKPESTVLVTDPDPDPDPEPVSATDLVDFSEYIASEVFSHLPNDLQTLTYHTIKENPELSDQYSLPLTLDNLETITAQVPPEVCDTLTSYGLIAPPTSDIQSFLSPVLSSYIPLATAAPPPPSTTRSTECQLCARSWIPLTYHHLIPRSTHDRVLKRGWHDQSQLNNVAWLCRACHSFVHRMASNEELAKEWFTVERIESREDIQIWVNWIAKVRWKKK